MLQLHMLRTGLDDVRQALGTVWAADRPLGAVVPRKDTEDQHEIEVDASGVEPRQHHERLA